MNHSRLFPPFITVLAALVSGCGGRNKGYDITMDRVFCTVPSSGTALGCAKIGKGKTPTKKKQELNLNPAVQTFESCAAAESYVRESLINRANKELASYVYYQSRYSGGTEETTTQASAAPMKGDGKAASSGPSGHTGTNNQVQGVDEGDIVKTDGSHIYLARSNDYRTTELSILASWPASSLSLKGSLQIEGRPISLLLSEDKRRIFVVSESYSYASGDGSSPSSRTSFIPIATGSVTIASLVDVSNPQEPKLLTQKFFNGHAGETRLINNRAMLAITDNLDSPAEVKTWIENGWHMSHKNLAAAAEKQSQQNRDIIRSKSLKELINGSSNEKFTDLIDFSTCSNLKRPTSSEEIGLVSLVSLDMDSLNMSAENLLTKGGTLYANSSSIYVAAYHWNWWFDSWDDSSSNSKEGTYLHKFNWNQGEPAYTASGTVTGHINDQFSMDEHKGYLRVATTINNWRARSSNQLFVLKQEENALRTVGKIDNIAPGETIQSARFFGDRGYLVTFRQVDPLFSIDLSKPEAPAIKGKLKVPGFSTYIHPLDANHLLTVGYHADARTGRTFSPKITVFDVTDFSHPREESTATVSDGSNYAYSEATWDHKAFNFFARRNLLAIPVTSYAYRSGSYAMQSKLNLYRVVADQGIVSLGALDMSDVGVTHQYEWGTWREQAYITRSIMAFSETNDASSDFVYAISDMGVRSANLANLANPLATVTFPKAKPKGWYSGGLLMPD